MMLPASPDLYPWYALRVKSHFELVSSQAFRAMGFAEFAAGVSQPPVLVGPGQRAEYAVVSRLFILAFR
jgi:hypothetical protein